MEHFIQTFDINGYIADQFVDSYDEEYVLEYMGERYKEDSLIYVMEKGQVPEGCSRLGLLSMDTGKIQVGPDKVVDAKYAPYPDYGGIRSMYADADRCQAGDMSAYNYFPEAKPIIATNNLVDCDESKKVDSVAIERGRKIVEPTPGQTAMCDDSNSESYSDNLKGKFFDRYGMYFRSPAAYKDGCEIIALQFNPFAPRSAKMIEQSSWVSETKVRGTYKYRGKIYKFEYDLKSKLFRYHADVWMKKWGIDLKIQYHYQSFDMVCVKRFLEDTVVDRCVSVGDSATGVFVEPIYSDRVPVLDYSIIGPWEGEVSRGILNETFFVPYLTPKIELLDMNGGNLFSHVMDFDVSSDEVFDREKKVRMKFYKGIVSNPDYYIRRAGKDYSLVRKDPEGPSRLYAVNFKVKTQYCNKFGSVIEHPLTISLVDHVREVGKNLLDQRMESWDWSNTVSGRGVMFKKNSATNHEDTSSDEEVDYNEKIAINSGRSMFIQGLKRVKPKIIDPVIKDTEEKIISAITDHKYGPNYKNYKFEKFHYTKDKRQVKKENYELDKLRLGMIQNIDDE